MWFEDTRYSYAEIQSLDSEAEHWLVADLGPLQQGNRGSHATQCSAYKFLLLSRLPSLRQ